jgi:hypothetical protein
MQAHTGSTGTAPLFLKEEGWVGTMAGLGRCGKSWPPPGFDPQTIQAIASPKPMLSWPIVL